MASNFDHGVRLPLDERDVLAFRILDNGVALHLGVGDDLEHGLPLVVDHRAVENVGIERREEERDQVRVRGIRDVWERPKD